MTNQQAREFFNRIAAAHRAAGNPDQASRIEVAREYFTNPEFKAAFEQFVWEINQAQG